MVGPEGLEPPTPGLKVRTLISRSVPLPTEEARSVRHFDLSFPSQYRPFLCYSGPPVSYPLAVLDPWKHPTPLRPRQLHQASFFPLPCPAAADIPCWFRVPVFSTDTGCALAGGRATGGRTTGWLGVLPPALPNAWPVEGEGAWALACPLGGGFTLTR